MCSSTRKYDYNTLSLFYGLTNDFEKAGYILPNGKMLDFSGNHIGYFNKDPEDKGKCLRHDSIFGVNKEGFRLLDVYPELYETDEIVYNLINKFNLVRVNFNHNIFSFTPAITDQQIDTLLKMFEEDSVNISLIDTDNKIIASENIEFLTRQSLLKFVKN